ncbi:beta-1,4-galactosyltransferase 7 [Leguminivora glycinivorella]|uniref:beta-1,4-galactosyltransferase 7 n=1 Tax=Leguminivora glycinivorella TaxID=1035111 RepID=UPI00200DFAF4|nr:beta-1,4-galactosyltransferase 7 [Leguminivora glycinivorella]
MGYRMCGLKCLFTCLGLTCIVGCYLAILPIENEKLPSPKLIQKHSSKLSQKQRLAVIVPFRDRFEELLEFVPHMHDFLNRQGILFHIFVIQQKDNNRFNRASLINVGFLHTKKDYDYIAMHDVDLLPMNDNLKYTYPAANPVHISSPQTHPNYHYATFIGGILLIRREQFELVHGMSNNYWGWGLEDDEFYLRLKDAGLQVQRPAGITTGPEDTFKHIHDKTYRRRDHRKCFNQREVTRRRDRETGLRDVAYRVHSEHALTVDGLEATVVTVELVCDEKKTPWCQCPSTVVKKPEAKAKS